MDAARKRGASERDQISPPPSRKRKLESGTTKDAVKSFFTPSSSKPSGKITWVTIDSTLLAGHFLPSSSVSGQLRRDKRRKIAAFDLDSTLIKPASGKKPTKDAEDWMWWHPSVPKRLAQLDDQGYQIAIISNQGGIRLNSDSKTAKVDSKRVADFKSKIHSILRQLDIQLSFYAATERDRFRKPRNGTWSELLEHYDLDGELPEAVDLDQSFFVGDAGGRVAGEGEDHNFEDKDFASSDLDFALNTGIKFQSPDEFFLGKAPRLFQSSFQPRKYLDIEKDTPSPFVKKNPQDIVLLVGLPGAGKSTFYWNKLAPLGYERINQDNLKTRNKCFDVAEEYLAIGKSVAVDNTNANPDTRGLWVKVAQRHKIPIRCVCLMSDAKLCEHNDAVRSMNGLLMNPEGRTRIAVQVIMSFAKQFSAPRLDEGFQDISSVQFRFEGTKEQEAAWAQYYI